jgi:predicted nuclease of predicted toxin-antitoxin system
LKFLVDQCLSAELAEGLSAAGHDAVHVSAYELSRADDREILARAAEEDRVLLSAGCRFRATITRGRDSAVIGTT